MKIRIIPATICTALMLLFVRVVDMTHPTAEAIAQSAAPASAPASTPAAKADDSKAAPNKEDKKEGGDKKEGEDKKEGNNGKKSNPNVSEEAGETVDHRYTPIELDLLQNLVRRREELDRWEKNIEVKENALNATEKRVDDKIAQIEAMRKEVSALLAQYNEKEDAKIRSLVKIYQGMKPKDAARIFDELDMPILLQVIDKMPEKSTSPILALMDPKKAKAITVQLAEARRVSSQKGLDGSGLTGAAPGR